MDGDCEDEDVVMEDSQLHKYLEEIGVSSTEYECTPRSKLHDDGSIEKTSLWKKCVSWFSSIIRISHTSDRVSLPQEEMTLESECCAQYIKLLQNSEVLTEDDAKFLDSCIQSGGSVATSKLNFKRHFMQRLVSFIVPGAALAACIVDSVFIHGTASSSLAWAVESATASGLAIYCCLEAGSMWSSSRKDQQHTRNMTALKNFVRCSEAFNDLVKKAVRLIQELEIVARGFTLVLPSTPVANLELSSLPIHRVKQQCPALRMTVFHAARDVAIAFQEATLQLLKKYDLKSSVDHHSHYLASLPLCQFGPLLLISEGKDDGVNGGDGGYTLASVKAIWQLSCLLQSEYLRRLGLCLCPELHIKENLKDFSIFGNLTSHVANLHDVLQMKTEAVKQSYNFHTSVGVKQSKMSEDDCSIKKPRHPESKKRDLRIALHSLTLHLQSALARSADMESQLENGEVNACNNLEDLYENLLLQLQSVKAELDACTSCLDESNLQLDVQFGKVQVQTGHKWSSVPPIINKEAKGHQNPIPLFELGDPVVEDQVFEAYVSSDEDDSTPSEYEEYITDARYNTEKYNLEKENSRKMFKELKSILTIKAHEWKEREANALKKVKQQQQQQQQNEDELVTASDVTVKPPSTDSESGQYLDSVGESRTSSENGEVEPAKSDFVDCNTNGLKDSPNESCNATLLSPLLASQDSADIVLKTDDRQTACIDQTTRLVPVNDFSLNTSDKTLTEVSNSGLGFAANVAAMAAARSRSFGAMANQVIHTAEAEEFGSDTDSDCADKVDL